MTYIRCSKVANEYSLTTVDLGTCELFLHIAGGKCIRILTKRYKCIENFLKGTTKIVFKSACKVIFLSLCTKDAISVY